MIEALGAAIVAIIAAFFWGNRRGKKTVADQQTKDYADERKRQDEVNTGIGASDADRIKRLRDIAGGGS
jgi:FtsZ-interacting cell division protein ZipA